MRMTSNKPEVKGKLEVYRERFVTKCRREETENVLVALLPTAQLLLLNHERNLLFEHR